MTPTREQEAFIEGVAEHFGGARVMRLSPESAESALVVVPLAHGMQVAAPLFVPSDVGHERLARAATAAEISRAQTWALRIARAGRPPLHVHEEAS
jgi:hypothetical protein